jgi:hypothetical protein
MNLTPWDIRLGVDKVKHWNRLDTDRVCVAALSIILIAFPGEFCTWCRCLANSIFMRTWIAPAKAFGNKSKHADISGVRVIVPLPSLLSVMDRTLSIRQLTSSIPLLCGLFFGARSRTQALDIAHSLAQVIEKGHDMRWAYDFL